MRKSARLFLIALLAVVLVCSLAACDIGSDNGSQNSVVSSSKGTAAMFEFDVPYKFQNGTVLPMGYQDGLSEAKIAEIKYRVLYSKNIAGANKLVGYGEMQSLSMSMIKSDDQAKLSKSGKHSITVFATIDGKYVETEISIKLAKYTADYKVTCNFDLNGGQLAQGSLISSSNTADIYKGQVISFSEFISKFKVSKADAALSKWTYGTDGITFNDEFSSSSQALTIDKNYYFKAHWETDKIKVSFDTSSEAFVPNFTIPTENVVKNKGYIPQPILDGNIKSGYSFAGWYTDAQATQNLWNFNNSVKNTDIVLYPKFTKQTYSLKIFAKGGLFDSLTTTPTETLTANSYSSFNKVDPYGVITLTINDLEYGKKYSDYKVNATVKCVNTAATGKAPVFEYTQAVVSLKEIASLLSKSKDMPVAGTNNVEKVEFYKVDGLYEDPNTMYDEGSIKFDLLTSTVNEDVELYAKWLVNDDLKLQGSEQYKDVLYDYLFGNNLTLKADGTLRLDKVADTTIDELQIPAKARYNGKEYPLTEIGENACMNFRSLTRLDLRYATNLTKIGKNAFLMCSYLKYVFLPAAASDCKISEIGAGAFDDTLFKRLALDDPNVNFLAINNNLIAYTGDKNATTLTIPTGITSISANSFSGLKALTTVNLPASVRFVRSGAFSGCTLLDTIEGANGLEYASDTAFDNTKFMNNSGMLLIGNYLYRYKTNDTTVTIPSNVKYIGESAFLGIELSNLIFENEAAILNVYKDAFMGTPFAITDKMISANTYVKSGMVVINNIFCTYTGNEKVVSIPNGVKTIAPYAFSGYNNSMVEDIIIPSSVTNIGDYAFVDAFRGTFSSSTKNYNALTVFSLANNCAPQAFANKNGVLPSTIRFFFIDDVMKNLTGLTGFWKQLYENVYQPDNTKFATIQVSSVMFNREIVDSEYLSDTEFSIDVIKNKLRNGNASLQRIIGGIYVSYVGGATAKEDLVLDKLKLTSGTLSYLYFGKSATIEVSAYNTIQTSASDTISSDGKLVIVNSNSATPSIKIIGEFFDTNSFYTSTTKLNYNGLKLEFVYKKDPATKKQITITEEMVNDYSNVEGEHTMYVDLKFSNLITYRVNYTYQTKRVDYESIKQVGDIAVPLGGDAKKYLTSDKFEIYANDGIVRRIQKTEFLTASVIDGVHTSQFDTGKIGYHTATLTYSDGKNKNLTFDINFAVVYEMNYKIFDYEFIVNSLSNGTKTYTAYIKGFKPTISFSSGVLLLPSFVSPENAGVSLPGANSAYNTNLFKVVGISDVDTANRVYGFQNNHYINYVILPDEIAYIGNNSFNGCDNLQWLAPYDSYTTLAHSASGISVTQGVVTSENLIPTSEIISKTQSATITGLKDGVQYLSELYIPESVYNLTNSSIKNQSFGGINYSYPSKTYEYFNNITIDPTRTDMFINFNGTIWLPSSMAYFYTEHKNTIFNQKTVKFYAGSSKDNLSLDLFLFSAGTTTQKITKNLKVPANYVPVYQDTTVLTNNTLIIPGSFNGDGYEYTVTEIENNAFNNLSGVRLCLPDTIVSKGTNTFTQYTNLTIFDADEPFIPIATSKNSLPSKLEKIGKLAFSKTDLKSLNFDSASNLKVIGIAAFDGSKIEKVDVSKSVLLQGIRSGAFQNCNTLKQLLLPNQAIDIEGTAFYNCQQLYYVAALDASSQFDTTLAQYSRSNFGNDAFSGCKSLIRFKSGTEYDNIFTDTFEVSNIIFEVSGSNAVVKGFLSNQNVKTHLSLPRSVTISGTVYNVTEIAKDAFKGTAIQYIALPDTITKIGAGAFSGCANLTEIVLPDSVKDIGLDAFANCNNLKYEVKNGLKYIGKWVFGLSDLSLITITIENGTYGIYSGAFKAIYTLENVVIPNSVKFIGQDAFNGCTAMKTIKFAAADLSGITVGTNWNDFNANGIIEPAENSKISYNYVG